MFKNTIISKYAWNTMKPTSWPTFDGTALSRHDVLTASESGTCIRRLASEKAHGKRGSTDENFDYEAEVRKKIHDITRDNNHSEGYFARGDTIEAWVADLLQQHNDCAAEGEPIYTHFGDNQVSLHLTETVEDENIAYLSGTPDCWRLDYATKKFRVGEFKSVGNLPSRPRLQHRKQVLQNILIAKVLMDDDRTGFMDKMGWDKLIPADEFDEWEIDDCGTLLYIESNNFFNMVEREIEYDKGLVAAIYEKERELFNDDGSVKHPSKLPAEGLRNSGCFFCPYPVQEACKRIEAAARRDAKKSDDAVAADDEQEEDAPRPSGGGALATFLSAAEDAGKGEELNSFFGLLDGLADARKEEARIKAKVERLSEEAMTMLLGQLDYDAEASISFPFDEDKGTFSVSYRPPSTSNRIDSKKVAKLMAEHGYTEADYKTASATKAGFVVRWNNG